MDSESIPNAAPLPSNFTNAAQAVNPASAPRVVVEPQRVLTIKPSLIAALLLRIVLCAILIGVVIGALQVANKLAGFDIIAYLLKAGRDASTNLQALVPDFAALLSNALSSLNTALMAIAVLVAAVVVLRAIPLVAKRWVLYEDRLECSHGLKDRMAPLAAIALVGSKRYLPFFDIGSITVVLSGISNQPITIPMVIGADAKAERIRTVQRAAQEGWMRQSVQIQNQTR